MSKASPLKRAGSSTGTRFAPQERGSRIRANSGKGSNGGRKTLSASEVRNVSNTAYGSGTLAQIQLTIEAQTISRRFIQAKRSALVDFAPFGCEIGLGVSGGWALGDAPSNKRTRLSVKSSGTSNGSIPKSTCHNASYF